MSRSNPDLDRTMPKNPARFIIRWKGGKEKKGQWEVYDREKESRSDIPAKLAMIVLDETKTVTGYSKPRGKGVYATEVRSNNDSLKVFHHGEKEPFAEGKWTDIRDVATSARNGGKYAVAVYALVNINGSNELAKLMISGASLGPWFTFTGEHNTKAQDAVVYCSGAVLNKTGEIPFYEPVFQLKKMTKPESITEAVEADAQLQRYFAEYFAAPQTDSKAPPHHNDDAEEEESEPDIESEEEPDDDIMPF